MTGWDAAMQKEQPFPVFNTVHAVDEIDAIEVLLSTRGTELTEHLVHVKLPSAGF